MKSVFTFIFLLSAVQAAPAPSASGNPSLRGSKDLVGYSPSRDVPMKNTTIPYQLVKGQKEDADKGVYLDFQTVEQPQAIRGSKGGTDPGPRTFPPR